MKEEQLIRYLVQDNSGKFFLSQQNESYFYFLNIEPVELKQQEMWLILSEYIDDAFGVRISEITGTFNNKPVIRHKEYFDSDDIVKLAGGLDKISSISLIREHIEDNKLIIHQSGQIVLEYNHLTGISPYVEELMDLIPGLIQQNRDSSKFYRHA